MVLTLAFFSCGTGPWFIQNNLYHIYKEPICKDSEFRIRTDGYYQLFDSTKVDYYKNIIVFNIKGYCTFLSHSDIQNLIKTNEPIVAELDWWKINNDSIIIENYGENKRLIKSVVWWHKGRVLNDSIFEIVYQDDYYKYEPVKYEFVQFDKIPELKNEARYIGKNWYESKLKMNKENKHYLQNGLI